MFASEETNTIINRVNIKPQIPFKVKGHERLQRGLERVKNTAQRNNGVICHMPEHCYLYPTGAPGFSRGLTTVETGPGGVNRKTTHQHSLG